MAKKGKRGGIGSKKSGGIGHRNHGIGHHHHGIRHGIGHGIGHNRSHFNRRHVGIQRYGSFGRRGLLNSRRPLRFGVSRFSRSRRFHGGSGGTISCTF